MTDTHRRLTFAADALFTDLGCNSPPIVLLGHFSQTHLVVIQHAPLTCPHAKESRLTGLNAVRSYFDILATHWDRSEPKRHSLVVKEDTMQVDVAASVKWTWKASGKSFREDFTCTLDFDEHAKVTSFIMNTTSGPGTCVMRAVDIEDTVDQTVPVIQQWDKSYGENWQM
ncbi:hypothetical protein C8J56DRAFT_969277 [Mycena floridula]|nr:hypothetical protein C8J56DRAFT_969277 [Mycena floridula]